MAGWGAVAPAWFDRPIGLECTVDRLFYLSGWSWWIMQSGWNGLSCRGEPIGAESL
jgi:hypothetical protein